MTHKELLLDPALKYKWYEYKAGNKPYYFEKLSNDEVNELLNIFSKMGEVIVDAISKEFNLAASLVKISLDQVSYSSFSSKNSIEYHADMEDDYSWFIPRQLLSVLISRGLGNTNHGFLEKELTPIEKSILEPIIQILIKNSQALWLGALESPSEFIINLELKNNPKIHKEDKVIKASVVMALGEYGDMNLEFMTSTKIIKKVLDKYISTVAGQKEKTINLEGSAVADIFVPADIVFGTTRVPMNEIMGMQKGDILQLDQRIGAPVVLKLGEKAEFVALLGENNNELVVRVEDIKQGNMDDVFKKASSSKSTTKASEKVSVKQNSTTRIADDSSVGVAKTPPAADVPPVSETLIQDIETQAEELDDDFNWDIDDL